VAVVGTLPELPSERELLLVRVECDDSGRPLGTLLQAKDQVEHLLDLPNKALLDQARQRMVDGLRRTLLGELLERDPAAAFVSAANRLGRQERRPIALALDGLELADSATLGSLEQILSRPGWLDVPLLLHFGSDTLPQPARRLLDVLHEREGEMAVFRRTGPATEPPPPSPESLPVEVRRVLRAAATIGERFDAQLVAQLLETTPIQVLYLLQVARDSGVPLADLGEGRFRMPRALCEEIGAHLMPSLSSAWHRRLARLLAERARPSRSRSAEGSVRPSEPAFERALDSGLHHRVPDSSPYHPPPSVASRSPLPPRVQPSRAARHAEAGGDVDLAVEQYVAAARDAAMHGAYEQATDFAHKAIDVLGSVTPSPERRILRVRALIELARVKWEAAIPGESSGLSDALELLGECEARLLPSDPVELRAEASALVAAVCYDIGDTPSLDRALGELGRASRALLDASLPLEAARLLNDEAAVWVRVGDPVRANHLLKKAREIFAARANDDPSARLAMAETDHLLARVVLHAPPRPGHERDAIELGIEHARRAEQAFEELKRPRELGRVWETLGRLEMTRGNQREAMEHLVAAADVQRSIGDVLGLARTSAALAEIARHAGEYERALGLLAGSVELNFEKGSRLGLAFNRKAIATLVRDLGASERDAMHEDFKAVVDRLSEAEEILGRSELPLDPLRPSSRPPPPR